MILFQAEVNLKQEDPVFMKEAMAGLLKLIAPPQA
jgi:hypothetical protein